MRDKTNSPIEYLRILRIRATQGFFFGKTPDKPQLKTSSIFEPFYAAMGTGILIGLIASIGFEIVIWIVHAFEFIKIDTIFRGANLFFWAAFLVFMAALLLPYINFLIGCLRYGIRKSTINFQNNPFFEKLYAHMTLSFCIVMTFSAQLAHPLKPLGLNSKTLKSWLFVG